MELNPESLSSSYRAKLMLGLVVPRPIAVISTISPAGQLNIGAFSYYSVVSDDPMVLSFSVTGPKPDGSMKDTLRNARPINEGGTGEFVINVAGDHYSEAISKIGASLPYGQSEFAHAGLTPAASQTVAPPRIAEARAGFECKTLRVIRFGEANLVIGAVKHVWIHDGIADERLRISAQKLQPLARLAGLQYCRVTDAFEIAPGVPSESANRGV